MYGSELDTTQKILQRINQYDKDFHLMGGDISTNYNLNETNNMHDISNISAIFPHQKLNLNNMNQDIGESYQPMASGYYSPPLRQHKQNIGHKNAQNGYKVEFVQIKDGGGTSVDGGSPLRIRNSDEDYMD